MASHAPASSPEMPITIKVVFAGKDENRKFKLPLKELGANSLPDKLRSLLHISTNQATVFERYSDSSSSFITLDNTVPSVYKQLYRAAKAKQKLKIRVTVTEKSAPKPVDHVLERLSTRCYVHPYISDPAKAEDEPKYSQDELPIREQSRNNNSTATLVNRPKLSSEAPRETSASSMSTLRMPLHWPMSHDGGFSEATKAVFEKKELGSQERSNKKKSEDEAPVPRCFTDREKILSQHANIAEKLESLRRATDQYRSPPGTNFTICCNNCEAAIPDVHWHCGICDMGDFDLCGSCVEKGNLCDNEDHWLIKRFVKDGKVIPSTTETIGPKKPTKVEREEKVPGAYTSEIKREESHQPHDLSRTCNSCVGVFDESNFVTCLNCEDYDLCIPCHVGLKHGHHPSHTFEPAAKDTQLTKLAHSLCAPGRNLRHYAICDGCDKDIYGVRHKCMDCPDWDFCASCVKDANKTHPEHRLVPLYEPSPVKGRSAHAHIGIFCDGPLCEGKHRYILGDRYKCAVCHDTDFCSKCEALPDPVHNKTHPLIKFKTPVRNVSVTTMGEKPNGEQLCTMGDLPPQTSSKSTGTTPKAPSANAATQVQTVAEVKPKEPVKEESKAENPTAVTELQAHFVRDLVPDDSIMPPSTRFSQVWTLRNPGPSAWPAGCCVCYIGGDGMLDVDSNHPSHVTQMYKATKSNVIDRTVEVGEEVDFHVVMRTPERTGKAISYWRLKDATGLPFGHKVWCEVNICKEEEQAKAEHIEDISKHATVEDEVVKEEQSESKMIFPKLDKESPVSSTHEALDAPVPAAPISAEEKGLLEDVESLELDDESDSDEAFLTDEEYELIATDDELQTAKNGKK